MPCINFNVFIIIGGFLALEADWKPSPRIRPSPLGRGGPPMLLTTSLIDGVVGVVGVTGVADVDAAVPFLI